MNRICVFSGSNPGARQEYISVAKALGVELARRRIGLVYGGANAGLMAALADACIEQGGTVTGVIPRLLVEHERAHRGLNELRVVESFDERQRLMAELSDGFIALPGGLGTLDELFDVLVRAQLGLHKKPCGLLDVCGFYRQLNAFLDRAVQERFIKHAHRNMLLVAESPTALLDQMVQYQAPAESKFFGA